ncbi:methyltransferase [Paraliomyxa miuraensis]|uniref:methyltransferase n=1 Tax=Paraliomyxa miuraensis TaxID=376150 RepID=UPI00224D7A5E|nr:methyltransferase [Paraliomyxa miuraensis]MCX4247041.1 methyltransferase [Paraliomyxa miuraensis]
MGADSSDRHDKTSARAAAQALAFGPLMFQAARVLRDSGALRELSTRGESGATEEELAGVTGLSLYAVRVLLEAGLVAEMLELHERRYRITLLGRMIQRDRMTRVNMDFVHDVCYRAGFHLEEALREGKPAGLRELGPWPTVYEGLRELPQDIRRSWFAFDHYYSDASFSRALVEVFRHRPRRLLDVGGNTGKWALQCCAHDPEVEVTIMDLPGQLEDARGKIAEAGLQARVRLHAGNLLDPGVPMPRGSDEAGFDAIWMSQFLDCFGEEEILTILRRAATALAEGGRLHVMETFWDRQPNETARYCVVGTSLYFAVVANGNSKMYHSERLHDLLEQAGFRVEHEVDGLGFGHTLLTARRRAR